MNPFPKALQKLISELGDLSADEQREFHMLITKKMLEVATIPQIRAIRADCITSHLCEWLGEVHRERVLNMIDGHIALRQMHLVRRRRSVASTPWLEFLE